MDTIIVEETPSTIEKKFDLKKFVPSKKTLIGIGAAVALTGAALWFAVKRSDEADFELEIPSTENL